MKRTSLFFLILTVAVAALFYLGIRKNAPLAAQMTRPNDPFIFRSVMDKQARMVTFALHDNLWVSYSADSCSLYKAWKGGVDFSGAVYNMQHGPQPMTIGNAWFVNAHRQPWRVESNGQSESPRVEYKGHQLGSGGGEIYYDLVLKNSQRIRINEHPEYVERDGQPGFERRFLVEDLPQGATVFFETNAASIVAKENIEVENGQFLVKKEEKMVAEQRSSASVEGEISIKNDGETVVRTWFINHPLVENPNDAERLAEASTLTPGERLINQSDCRTCHNPNAKTVGPAYAEIALKYLNTVENVENLVKKVKMGGSGVWGVAAMSAHPTMAIEEIRTIVQYIMAFDKKEDRGEGGKTAVAVSKILKSDEAVNIDGLAQGLSAAVWMLDKAPLAFKNVNWAAKPNQTGVLENINFMDTDFAMMGLNDNFLVAAEGYLSLSEDKNIDFRLVSDDGSRLFLDDQLMADNDGPHGMQPADFEVQLKKGYHKIRLDYWQGGGGRGLQMLWAPHGSIDFVPVPASYFSHGKLGEADEMRLGGSKNIIPGDILPLAGVHPSYTLTQARPDWLLPKVGGMDFDSKGNLYISTWDASGSIYKLTGVETGDPSKIKAVQIAKGLAEPLGVKVVDDTLFVLQKQEITKLVDTDGDGIMDDYQSFAKGWRASANFHEFSFGLAYRDGFFYATLATAINPGGASTRPQIPDRGKIVKIDRKTGAIEFIANGLRTPNGIGIGVDNELFVADNQGDWLPACKILHVKKDAFYNSFSVDSIGNLNKPVQQPVVWLPQDEIGNSASQPTYISAGPYKGQMLHGDVCYGGLQRVFVEKINGDYQGCVFKFSQGIEAGVNRLAWGPDGALYLGGVGNPGNWQHTGGLWYGLQRMQLNDKSAFEMLAVRAKTDGMELEFTEPLPEGEGWNAADYQIKQWFYKPTKEYGGPKMDEHALTVKSASVSADRKKVFLEIPNLKKGYVVYFHLKNTLTSESENEIWTTEGWYTLNNIPENQPGNRSNAPTDFGKVGDNELSKKEKKEGFQLLFDGKMINNWRNYKKTTVGSSWKISENAIFLDCKPSENGHWQAADGGDLVSAEEYENFDLKLEWKISACGNSGVFFNVVESPDYDYGWQTGAEIQVLDNTCHPDSRIEKHRAGDLYDLITVKYETVKPAGEWNKLRIRVKNGHLEEWLNGRKVVETQMWDANWTAMIKKSKFKDMKGFGQSKKGKISLQDHGNPVWFKNLRIRRL